MWCFVLHLLVQGVLLGNKHSFSSCIYYIQVSHTYQFLFIQARKTNPEFHLTDCDLCVT